MRHPPFTWTCPYCGRDTTITDAQFWRSDSAVKLARSSDGDRWLSLEVITCPNPDCTRFAFTVTEALTEEPRNIPGARIWPPPVGDVVHTWRLVPASNAKVFPEYVPEAIRTTYVEACSIAELSAQASATLSRRALQGMIRDFWQTPKLPNLWAEIEAIKEKIDPATRKAIDGVRSVGNIGAHMHQDVNLIIEVDPDEAALLIWLIETLMSDWYVSRAERAANLQQIARIGEDKKAQQNSKD